MRAIHNERFKYVWNPQAEDELYDLQVDPHEVDNLSGQLQQAAIEVNLGEQLTAWLATIGDDLPVRVSDLPPAGTIMATVEPGPSRIKKRHCRGRQRSPRHPAAGIGLGSQPRRLDPRPFK